MKRSPEKVLNSLTEHSENLNYKFERLYRILFNEEMYYAAYQRIYAKPGNMTAGADGQTIDQMSLSRIETLIASLKDESYQPQPSKRVYIPKKNGKMRPLGVPAFNDKLVQEVIRMILESIYEGQFEIISHGFRPQRSCHTALSDIDKTFDGVKWFIEGDIKGFFDNINHEILIGILKERIADERFIRLIRKFLNAGYIEDWHFHNSYSGTPQGGIVSPILANIYLDKLDKYMKEYTENFDKGKKRKVNKQAVSLEGKKHRVTGKLKMVKEENERSELVRQLKAYQKETLLYSYGDEMDMDYRKIKYVRYADDFLIGIIGDKQDAIAIKEDVENFLNEKLGLELSEEKTLITHSESSAKFLGYEISVRKSNVTKRTKNGDLRRPYNKRVQLKLGKDTIKKKLLEYRVLEIKIHNGQELWKAKSRPKLSNNNDFEILDRYNKEIRGMYNYYCMADNCNTLSKLRYIMLYSMYKTFAQKYRSTMSQIRNRYTKNGLFSVKHYLKSGVAKDQTFYHEGFKQKNPMKSMNLDNLPKFTYYAIRPTLVDRLRAEQCELCGAVDKLMMHHVRKLKNLKGDSPIEKQMIARKRKTIAICSKCQKKLSNNEKNRLILLVESRIRGDVYVRFGGEHPKTHRRNTAGRWMLSLPLKSVNNLVKDARKVQQTILMVGEISDIYMINFQRMMQDKNYTVEELGAIAFGYTKLLEESAGLLTELKGIVNVSTLSMSDKERMDLINGIHHNVKEYRNLVNYYTNKNIVVSYLRSKKTGDTQRVLALYGDANDRYW